VSGNVNGVDLVLDLPSGVSVAADADGNIYASVLAAVGPAAGNSLTAAKYTAASGSAPGKVHIGLASSAGFAVGEFIALRCAVAQGATPTFSSSLLEPGAILTDANGAAAHGAVTLNALL